MNSLPLEIVQRIVELVPLDALVALLCATKLTRTCVLRMLEVLETVTATVNEIPFEVRVAIVLHCTSLKTITGLVVKSVDLTKGFSVSMTIHLLRRNSQLHHLVLYDSIPTTSYSATLFSTVNQYCPNLKSIYSEAEHSTVSLVSTFICTASKLEEISFPNSPLSSLLAGDIDGVNCGEVAQGVSWSQGPSIYGLHHGTDCRRKVLMWRKESAIDASRGLVLDNRAPPALKSSVPAPPGQIPLRASPNSLRFSTQFSQLPRDHTSPCSSPVPGRRSPLAQSGPRSLGGFSFSSDFQQQDFQSLREQQPLFMSRSTGFLREGTTTA